MEAAQSLGNYSPVFFQWSRRWWKPANSERTGCEGDSGCAAFAACWLAEYS